MDGNSPPVTSDINVLISVNDDERNSILNFL